VEQDLKADVPRILAVSAGHFVHDIFPSFLAPLLPLLIDKFSLAFFAAGLIPVMLRLPSWLNPVLGAWVDRTGMQRVVILSPVLTAAAISTMGMAPSYWMILLMALVAGISSVLFHVPSPVLIHRLAGRRVGLAMSSFQLGGESARTVGPLLLLGALSLWPMERLFLLIPLGAAASLLLHRGLRGLPQTAGDRGRGIGGSIADTLRSAPRLFTGVAGVLLGKCLTASMLAVYLPALLVARGNSIYFAGGALSIVEGAAVAGVLATGPISDRFGGRWVLIVLAAATPCAAALLLFAKGWLLVPALILAGLASFSSAPVILSIIQRRGLAYPAAANGVYMTINFALGSITVLLGGGLADRVGIEKALLAFALISVVGVPGALLIRDR